jgi:hypothetical protein
MTLVVLLRDASYDTAGFDKLKSASGSFYWRYRRNRTYFKVSHCNAEVL